MTKQTDEAPKGLDGKDPAADQQILSNRTPASDPAVLTSVTAPTLPVVPSAEARPEGAISGISPREAESGLNFTDNGPGIAIPRKAVQVFSNRALNQLPEGQVPAPPVDGTPSGKQVAQHNQKNTAGFGKE